MSEIKGELASKFNSLDLSTLEDSNNQLIEEINHVCDEVDTSLDLPFMLAQIHALDIIGET
jgi:hypothetical protein